MNSLLGQTNLWEAFDVGRDLFLFSPMIAMVCTMLLIVACPIVIGRGTRTISVAASFGIAVTFFLAWRVMGTVGDAAVSGFSAEPFLGLLVADKLSVGFQLLLMVFLAGVSLLWLMGSARTERNAPEFFILLIGSALGMSLMVSSANLLTMVIAIEMASIPSYAIVGFDKRDRVGAEASLKYMIFGAVCAAIMLYGTSLVYGLVGSLSMTEIAAFTVAQMSGGANVTLLGVALSCVFVGIAFKISAVPFHFWCPDAFQGAKIEVTTWLSVASKAAGLVMLARFMSMMCAAVPSELNMNLLTPLAWVIGVLAAVTATVGNFAAYKQQSVKRMLAYSSIAHAGYMMMATAVFIHPSASGAGAGMSAMLMYIVIYMFMNLCAFGVTAMVSWEAGTDDIEGFNGLIRRSPLLAVPMVIALMSLIGMPPMAGFIGKWWILVALGQTGTLLGWSLVVVASVNTLISLYYYMRIVVQMGIRDSGRRPAFSSPLSGLALVNVCAVVLLVLFFAAGPFKERVAGFSTSLYSVTVTSPVSHESLAVADQEAGQ